ncbi:hypothetical protein NC99_43180 [Sunxiuqinia dokdonensis]|uniref:Uncharacterized protein n=1 Tax=Sunxiuqinia dokdonensis TaxID=1409788 RepID=A0A0L8V2Z7_9BACT|nr:hypothetical protein NC99_43180 [Sunxiuqinia dokdonensis]
MNESETERTFQQTKAACTRRITTRFQQFNSPVAPDEWS